MWKWFLANEVYYTIVIAYRRFHVGDEVGAKEGQELFEFDLPGNGFVPTKFTSHPLKLFIA